MAKPYIVKRNELYCTWEEDISELPKNTVVLAGEGTQVIHYVNGTVEKTYYPSNKDKKSWLVVNTGAMKKRGDEAVVGVNSDGVNKGKEFTIVWGIGGVPYSDESGIETQVGMNGEFKFVIQQYTKLIGTLAKNNITPKDIKEFTAAKLQETLCSELADKLRGLAYHDVMVKQSIISDAIKHAYEGELETLGIKLTSFSLKEIFFQEDYLGAREEGREDDSNGMLAYIKAHEDAKMKAEEDAKAAQIINSLKASAGAAYHTGQSQNNISQEPSVRMSHYCPKCGKEQASGAKFCDRCGAKL